MIKKIAIALVLATLCVVTLGACSATDSDPAEIDSSVLWVRTAAEYEALSLQAYQAADEDLQKFIDDQSWSALPGQTEATELPLAIILDIDETVVSNVEFQVILERPFRNSVRDAWSDSTTATPVPGAVDFIRNAQNAGVETFFITNRPCELNSGMENPCPQKEIALQDLLEAGFEVDNDHLMLANENLGWDREKSTRREHIGETHRVIMLFGDDLGDFIACSREKPLHPCDEAATIESRRAATIEFGRYWGEGWYILPNPMHGSWTTFN